MTTPASPATPATGFQPRSSATRFGCIFGSHSACTWSRKCWPAGSAGLSTYPPFLSQRESDTGVERICHVLPPRLMNAAAPAPSTEQDLWLYQIRGPSGSTLRQHFDSATKNNVFATPARFQNEMRRKKYRLRIWPTEAPRDGERPCNKQTRQLGALDLGIALATLSPNRRHRAPITLP